MVIPARNEAGSIEQCLQSVLGQTVQNLQVIVVDGASTDDTAAVVRRYQERDARLVLLSNPDAIIPKSLNTALVAAEGIWFIRVDAHSTIPPTYVELALRHLREGKWGGVGGRKDGVGVTATGRAIAAALGSPFGVGNSVYHHGSTVRTVDHIPFGAYPTALVRDLGGWDEGLVANEDFEFDYRLTRAGHKLLFDPSLRISWRSRQSIRELFRQYRRYGRAKVAVVRLHPDSLHARHLAPPALVACLTGAGVMGRRRPLFRALVVGSYAAGLVAASVLTAPKVDGRSAQLRLPLAFAAMHLGWGVGFWEGLTRWVSGSS
jgi:glycosyltransferase involved in cell wall biosynthesis